MLWQNVVCALGVVESVGDEIHVRYHYFRMRWTRML